MSKKAFFPLVIFSALLLSACTAKTPAGIGNQTGDTKSGGETEQSISTTMRDLLTAGKNQKCTISISETDEEGIKTDTNATLYISGKKMAEDINITSTDKEMPKTNMRMISDGTYVYTWNTDSKGQGMKMKFEETQVNDEKVPSADNSQAKGVNMDEKYDMKCGNWIVDNSKFAVPSDVQFTDLSEMLKNLPTMPANVPTGE